MIRVAEVALEASALENLRGVAKSIASTAEGMRLRELDVSYSGDSVVEAVTAFVMLCPKLRVLSMRLLGITDSMFQDMGMCLVGWLAGVASTLTDGNWWCCCALPAVCACPKLEEVVVARCNKLTGRSTMRSLASYGRHLKHLNVSW